MFRISGPSLLLSVLVCAAALAQSPQPARPPHASYPAKWEPKPQEVFISYWTLEPNWNTELEIRNNVVSRDLTVTPVLRTADGAEVQLKPVTVPPEHVAAVDVREALAVTAPELLDHDGSFGSVVFRFEANSEGNVFGASMVQRNGSPISFHFDEETIASDWSAGTTESIWWLPRPTASDWLIVANASKQPLEASLAVSDLAGHTFQQTIALGPAQTQRLDLRAVTKAAHLAGMAGGVKISVPSGAGNVIASHVVFDESVGMSAIMKTFDRDPAQKPSAHTMRAPMLALANPDPVLMFPDGTVLLPQVFMRNATAATLKANMALDWRSANQSGSLPLPEVTLAPGEIRVLDIAALTAHAQLPSDAYWGTVIVAYQGRPGDLVPIATTFDKTGRFGLQTPFSEGISHLWKGSMWHVDAKRNSLITAGNGGNVPTRAAVALFYNNGKESYKIEKLLQPGEQIWANVGEIIRNQIPDKDGKTIPPDVMMGSYELRDLDHRGVGYLYEGKLVIDKTWGHGYYGCAGCCAYIGSKLNPEPFDGPITTGGPDFAYADNGCTSSWDDVTSEAYNWSSSDSGIVKVASAYSNFVSVGSVTGSAYVQLQKQYARTNCPVTTFYPQNTQNTTASISWNGKVISNTTQSAVIGQQIALTGDPGGGTWSVPAFSAYGGFALGPPSPQNGQPTTGKPTPFATSGTNNTFYWVEGGTFAVTYSAGGSSTSATFNVAAPTATINPSPISGNGISLLGPSGFYVGAMCGTDTVACMAVSAAVTPPAGVSGTYRWVQIINSITVNATDANGKSHTCSLPETAPALDTSVPYTLRAVFTDIPSESFDVQSYNTFTISESFSTVVEWQPSLTNAMYVPIGYAGWGWGATVSFNYDTNQWALSSPVYPSASVNYSGTDWPTWNSLFITKVSTLSCK